MTTRRLWIGGVAFVALDVALLPILLPVLPVQTALDNNIISARGDYQSEIGWPEFARQVERSASGADAIVTANYGEAGALILFGHRLPPVASADVTMRYWRPQVEGREALLVGYTARGAPFCTSYRVVSRISTPGSDERGTEIARCTMRGALAQVWTQVEETSSTGSSSAGRRAHALRRRRQRHRPVRRRGARRRSPRGLGAPAARYTAIRRVENGWEVRLVVDRPVDRLE